MSRSERDKAKWMLLTQSQVTANLLTWLTVHGNLCLALRHPQNQGPSRRFVVDFVKQLGELLVAWGVITDEERAAAERIEVEEGSLDLG